MLTKGFASDLFALGREVVALKSKAKKRKSLAGLQRSQTLEAMYGKKSHMILDLIGFELFCRQIFTEADIDCSGTVDATEVQVMVLQLYVHRAVRCTGTGDGEMGGKAR